MPPPASDTPARMFLWASAATAGQSSRPAGIGLEPTLGEWVENIVAVRPGSVRRVLRDDGTFWLQHRRCLQSRLIFKTAYGVKAKRDGRHIGLPMPNLAN